MRIAGVLLKPYRQMGHPPRVAEVVNPGTYRPKTQPERDAVRLAPRVKPEPERLPIFTAAFVLENPEAAAAALNACYYDLVDAEKRSLAK